MRRDPLWRAVALLGVPVRRTVLALTLGSVALLSAVALAGVSAWLIARASQMPPVLDLSVAVVAVRAFGVSRGVFRYLDRLASHDLALAGMATLRTRLYRRLADGRIEAIAPLRRGDLLTRVGADVDTVGDVVVRGLLPLGVAAVVAVVTVGAVAVVLPSAAAILGLCLLVAGIGVPWLSAAATARTERSTAAARAEVAAGTLEVLDHAAELTLSGRLTERLEAVREADRRILALTDRAATALAGASALGVLAAGAGLLGTLLTGMGALADGRLDGVVLAVLVLTSLAAFEAVLVLPGAAVQVLRSRAAAIRIVEVLDAAEQDAPGREDDRASVGPGEVTVVPSEAVATPHEAVVLPRDAVAGAARLVTGGSRLTATGLACGWPGRPPTVHGLDLDLGPGDSVALVGPSGIGKTTVLLTLAGVLRPVAGGLGLPAWDRHTTLEDAHVFATSVLENLRVARGDTTPQEAVTALEQAGLGAWLAGLPDGLDTPMGGDAARISGGERRRLLIARALVSRARLLLLDEPAEHLEAGVADDLVRRALRGFPEASATATRATEQDDAAARATGPHGAHPSHGSRTVVIATHRLSALDDAGEVILLGPVAAPDGGLHTGVTARGTHRDLLERVEAYRWAWQREQQEDR